MGLQKVIRLYKYTGKGAGIRETDVYEHIYLAELAKKEKFNKAGRAYRAPFDGWVTKEALDQLDEIPDVIVKAPVKEVIVEDPPIVEDNKPELIDTPTSNDNTTIETLTPSEVGKLNKTKLVEYGTSLGLEVNDTMTNKKLKEIING